MESFMDDFDYHSGNLGIFPLDLDTSSLLDDGHHLSLKKIQGGDNTDVHHVMDHGLFPDLLPLDHDADPLSLDWMETLDMSHLTDNSEELKVDTSSVQCGLPITVQPEDIDLLQSLLQEASDQLTPPDSPAQVAPQIDLADVTFDHQVAWEVLNSPLSPQDVESLLSPSTAISPCVSPSPSISPSLTTSTDSLTPSGSRQASPLREDCPNIDLSLTCSAETISTKGRPKPYQRTTKRKAAQKKVTECDHDFSFRCDEKLSKRERKKLQNKNAATKYRMKKKEETIVLVEEEKLLEERNKELQNKVDQLTREISCMKDVLGDIYKGLEAKGKKTV